MSQRNSHSSKGNIGCNMAQSVHQRWTKNGLQLTACDWPSEACFLCSGCIHPCTIYRTDHNVNRRHSPRERERQKDALVCEVETDVEGIPQGNEPQRGELLLVFVHGRDADSVKKRSIRVRKSAFLVGPLLSRTSDIVCVGEETIRSEG